MASEDRFGYEWDTYRELDKNYELQFRTWLGPITPEFIRGKRVLDAGCGMGRNAYWCLKWGASQVVAFDNDDRTVEAARKILGGFPNAVVKKESIYDIEYQDEFDFAFSIGVVHHLEKPEVAIQNFVRALKPGGTLLVWLYSKEGNERLLAFLNPTRLYITSHLPPWMVHILSYFVSVPFYVFLKTVRPAGTYYAQLQNFRFKHIHSIVFDQLLPTIAKYYTKEEAKDLLKGMENVTVSRVHDAGWTVVGEKR